MGTALPQPLSYGRSTVWSSSLKGNTPSNLQIEGAPPTLSRGAAWCTAHTKILSAVVLNIDLAVAAFDLSFFGWFGLLFEAYAN